MGGDIIKSANLTQYGKSVKKRLIDMGQTQAWLIDQVKEMTGLYFDRSYLSKIQTGKLSTPKIIDAIDKVLGLPKEKGGAQHA